MHAVSVSPQRRSAVEITIDVPDDLYSLLEQYAKLRRETVEECIIELLEEVV